MKNEISNLHDLVELGLVLRKASLPNGFMTTVWVSKEAREKIYGDILDNDIDHQYWKLDGKDCSGYQFKVLKINFLVLSNN